MISLEKPNAHCSDWGRGRGTRRQVRPSRRQEPEPAPARPAVPYQCARLDRHRAAGVRPRVAHCCGAESDVRTSNPPPPPRGTARAGLRPLRPCTGGVRHCTGGHASGGPLTAPPLQHPAAPRGATAGSALAAGVRGGAGAAPLPQRAVGQDPTPADHFRTRTASMSSQYQVRAARPQFVRGERSTLATGRRWRPSGRGGRWWAPRRTSCPPPAPPSRRRSRPTPAQAATVGWPRAGTPRGMGLDGLGWRPAVAGSRVRC